MLKSLITSFGYAIAGIKTAFIEEQNFKIHTGAMLAVLSLGWYCGINRYEWLAILITIGMVLIAELFNTAIENLCDHVTPGHNVEIKRIKDMAAGGVLCVAIIAVIVGAIIFLPYVKEIIKI